jgi:hypothetical protein
MSLIALVVVLILVGAGLYLVGVLPIDATVKTIIRVVVIVAACLWVLEQIGALGGYKLHLH